MALPDYMKIEPGTAVIWGEDGAVGVTKTLTFEALASTKARMGVYADLGGQFDEEYLVQLIIESGTAPVAGGSIDLYLACADDTGRFPGAVSGADAAYNDGSEAEWLKQLGSPVCSLIATADGNTIQRQAPVIWRPSGRYVAPVVHNQWSQAVRDEATATDNDSRIILVPRRLLIQDAS